MILDKIVSEIKVSKTIAIVPHVSADGDAIGSSLAFAMALQKIGKQVKVFLEEDIPRMYGFLPRKELVEVYGGDNHFVDTVIALDTGDLERLGSRAEIYKLAKTTINIDHHKTNTEFAFYNYVNVDSSAVGEIVYQIIKMLDIELDRDMATCLYVAISTDTGGFRYSNTTAMTHQIVADLVKYGVNIAQISQQVFETTSLEKVKLMAEAINSLELFERGKIAVITVSDETLKKTGARDEDADGIVNIGRNILGVEAAVMLRHKNNGEIKVNLRSNHYVDVSAIANLYGGGGHKRAAGCTVKKEIMELKEMILKDIKDVL